MNNILIFSKARSGGNLLTQTMKTYSSVGRVGEFLRYSVWQNDKYPDVDKFTSNDIDNFIKTKELEYNGLVSSLVYRIHPIHLNLYPNVNIFEYSRRFDKIVVLYRENFLNLMVSLNVALKLRSWHYTDKSYLPKYSDFKFHLSKTYIANSLKYTVDYYNEIIDTHGIKNVEIIKYEDIIGNNINYTEFLDGLNIDITHTNYDIETLHINPNDDGYKSLINLDRLGEVKLKFNNKSQRFIGVS